MPTCNLDELKHFEYSEKLIEKLKKLPSIYEEHFECYNFYLAIDEIVATLHMTNSLVQESQPWVLAKNSEMNSKLDAILALVFESLRINGILLQPIVPNMAHKILDKINVSANRRSWNDTKYQLDLDQLERPLSGISSIIIGRIK